MMRSSRSCNNNKLFNITKITMTTQDTILRAIEIEEPDYQMDKPIAKWLDIKITSLLRPKIFFKMTKTTTQILRTNTTSARKC